ncbi:MAG TPA: CHAD domain-containing protein [Thermoplasmata archaeon]|nr:CHAD domain-containing protein [Thermoplasmata archaeon]
MATSTATRLASSPLRLRAQLVQVLDAVDRSVDTVIRRPHPPAPLLHDLHRDMRRLVGGLSVWAQVLPKRDATKLELLIPRARRLSRLVGRVRDKDVTIALFSRYAQETDDAEEAARILRFLMRLRDDARTGRELLRAFLRTERERGLFAEIGAFVTRPPARGPSERLRRLLAEEAATRHGRVTRARERARRRPSPERLHRLRIRVRQLRHFADLVAEVAPESVGRVPLVLRRLQSRLGRLHDLDVALGTLDPDLHGTAWARRLYNQRRRMRRQARVALAELSRVAKAQRAKARAP